MREGVGGADNKIIACPIAWKKTHTNLGREKTRHTCSPRLSLLQGSYTTGPSKFQDFSRTFKDHIYKNPGPVIARKTETIQTNQQTM